MQKQLRALALNKAREPGFDTKNKPKGFRSHFSISLMNYNDRLSHNV